VNKRNKYSAIILVVALFAELVIEINTNSVNGRMTAILERETAAANERSVELQRLLEIERTERLMLHKKFAWRHLDDDQLRRIIVSLLPFPELPFDGLVADTESLNLLSDISKALQSNAIRWIMKPHHGGSFVIRLSGGIVIGATLIDTRFVVSYDLGARDFAPAAKALAAALTAEGIEAIAEIEHHVPAADIDARIHLKIGSKPAF